MLFLSIKCLGMTLRFTSVCVCVFPGPLCTYSSLLSFIGIVLAVFSLLFFVRVLPLFPATFCFRGYILLLLLLNPRMHVYFIAVPSLTLLLSPFFYSRPPTVSFFSPPPTLPPSLAPQISPPFTFTPTYYPATYLSTDLSLSLSLLLFLLVQLTSSLHLFLTPPSSTVLATDSSSPPLWQTSVFISIFGYFYFTWPFFSLLLFYPRFYFPVYEVR